MFKIPLRQVMVAFYALHSVFAQTKLAPEFQEYTTILHGGGEKAVMYSAEWWFFIGLAICK
jgi:hypothetical protein